MKKIYKLARRSKGLIALFMIIADMRIAGLINNTVNMDAVKKYNEIIEDFANLLEEENINDIQHIYEYYNYAMWNGYFSKDKNFQYTLSRQTFIDNAGMSIMSGNGVCLNYADMLALIFNEMGYKSYPIMCLVDPNNANIEVIRTDKSITRNVDAENNLLMDNFIVKGIQKVFGNHAITCVEYNNELYFFDPTNLVYLNKTSINDLSIVNGQGKFDIRYFTSILFDNIDVFKLINSKNDDSYNEIVLEKQELNINIDELEKFYNSQRENIETVSEKTKYTGNLIALIIYLYITNFIIISFSKSLYILNSSFNDKDIIEYFPKLKEYFNDKNIKSEYEAILNYELLEHHLGVKNNYIKDILKRIIKIFNIVINKPSYPISLLKNCLNFMGYDVNICYATKISHSALKREIPLLSFTNNHTLYFYDYETEELLCKNELGEICSLDGKYIYDLSDSYNAFSLQKDYEISNKESIENKISKENIILTKEDIKLLRKEKKLRI